MFIFCDWETRARVDLKKHGVDRYAEDVTPFLFTYAIGDGPVQLWYPDQDPMPEDLRTALRDHYLVAFNSRFDRLVTRPAFDVPLEQWLDIGAQCQAWSLRGNLDQVCRGAGLPTKPRKGAQAMLAIADADLDLKTVTDETWDLFEEYAVHDVESLRGLWARTGKLTQEDWAAFHVSERINDRGLPVDVELAAACAKYRLEAQAENNAELERLTGIPKVSLAKQINAWVHANVIPSTQHLMEPEEGKLSLDSKRVLPRLIEENLEHGASDEIIDVLELLTHARSNVAVKFDKIVDQHVGGRIYGSFTFNGAGQTGRWSSRGIQVHNLTRAKLDNELEVINAVLDGAPLDTLRELSGQPINKMLERPLEVFRRSGDLYTESAQWMFQNPEGKRQASKVANLALQFGGAVGAYRAMARNYGLRPTNEEALDIVGRWRRANPWARAYWDQLITAARSTVRNQGGAIQVGRVALEYKPNLKALLLWLPSGRPLYYPRARFWTDPEDGREHLIFNRGQQVERLWHGKLMENAVQGCAADLLRNTLSRVEQHCVGHTHDEVLLEVVEPIDLETVMTTAPAWAEDLPLDAEVEVDDYYHK
jgi:DNA polymerase